MGGGHDAAEQEGASASSEWAKLHAAPRAHVPRCQNLHGPSHVGNAQAEPLAGGGDGGG